MLKQIKLFLFTVAALASATMSLGQSAAAEKGSNEFPEYFYQPAAGQHMVQPGLEYSKFVYRQKGSTDFDQSGFTGGVLYNYGLNTNLAFGARLAFESSTSKFNSLSNSVSGLSDPKLYVIGAHGLDFGTLHYGLDINAGLMKGELDSSTGFPKTSATGAWSFAPYAGLSMKTGPGVAGAKLKYDIRGDRTFNLSGTGDTKYKHGNFLSLSGFYEQLFLDMLMGAEIGYTSVEKTTIVGPTGISTDVAAESQVLISLYGRLPAANFQLIPRISYAMKAAGENLEKYSLVQLSLAGRWAF